ncbi:dephospho-CoA kinase [Sulfuritortus calidifontis]|uniref:Dephospho-CoA kinase n=2 Tax=Sulfuritortus calidifontis TaxID=1914471 RepID=A0A4R3JWF3_9PROT|nr:dephospho-CoA kinase [Sulfuritortus calidifontis]
MFADLGVAIIDTDRISRELTAAGGAAMAAIRAEFGEVMVRPDGSLDRPRMREQVFADSAARQRLEAILHPMIRAEAERQLAAVQGGTYAMLVVPLLVETGAYRKLIDRVLVVDCDESRQLRRIVSRDGLDEAQARAILAAQADRQQRLAAADDVLENQGSLEALRGKVAALHAKYQKMAQAAR